MGDVGAWNNVQEASATTGLMQTVLTFGGGSVVTFVANRIYVKVVSRADAEDVRADLAKIESYLRCLEKEDIAEVDAARGPGMLPVAELVKLFKSCVLAQNHTGSARLTLR